VGPSGVFLVRKTLTDTSLLLARYEHKVLKSISTKNVFTGFLLCMCCILSQENKIYVAVNVIPGFNYWEMEKKASFIGFPKHKTKFRTNST
jgi:hypothetical protein